jgi:hypothetical protein
MSKNSLGYRLQTADGNHWFVEKKETLLGNQYTIWKNNTEAAVVLGKDACLAAWRMLTGFEYGSFPTGLNWTSFTAFDEID